MTFLHAAFLFGFAALAIPPVVHLLNRRRYETVPWAAMMFLPESTETRQRFRFQHFPLMLLRMGLLAALVLAFAAPQFPGCQSSRTGRNAPKDILVLIDTSASMARGKPGQTPADRAKAYLSKWLDDLGPQQRIAIRSVKHRSVPVLDDFTADRGLARNCLELLPNASGVADWPAAVQDANAFLENRGECEIVVLTDDTRFGWSDPDTLTKWGLLAQSSLKKFPLHVVTFPGDTQGLSNARLDPIRTDRATAVAQREIPFRSTVRFTGPHEPVPVRVSVDGLAVNTLNVTATEGELSVPLTFSHAFTAGSHLVTLELPDDDFPGDNRQDFALEVLPIIPVLIVDGTPAGSRRTSDFLRDALAPPKDATPAFLVRTVTATDWTPGLLHRQLAGPGTAPRAIALMNIEKWTSDQARQIEEFLRHGGSVFVAPGPNCDVAAWNRIAYRGGEGFLPARIGSTTGELDLDTLAGVPRPLTASFSHPALEIFKEPLPGGLATALFPKYWKIDPNAGTKGTTGSVVAAFTNRDPWLVESAFGAGRVILASHPFDDSWKTNLHRLPDFVRLTHELFYFLSGHVATQRNLQPGQSILFQRQGDEPPGEVRIRYPDGRVRSRVAAAWPMVIDADGDPGAYLITTATGRQSWYCVGYDPRESDFAPCTRQDRDRVAEVAGRLNYVPESESVTLEARAAVEPWNLGWILLGLVLAILFGEIFFTRKLVRTGEHAMPEGAGR